MSYPSNREVLNQIISHYFRVANDDITAQTGQTIGSNIPSIKLKDLNDILTSEGIRCPPLQKVFIEYSDYELGQLSLEDQIEIASQLEQASKVVEACEHEILLTIFSAYTSGQGSTISGQSCSDECINAIDVDLKELTTICRQCNTHLGCIHVGYYMNLLMGKQNKKFTEHATNIVTPTGDPNRCLCEYCGEELPTIDKTGNAALSSKVNSYVELLNQKWEGFGDYILRVCGSAKSLLNDKITKNPVFASNEFGTLFLSMLLNTCGELMYLGNSIDEVKREFYACVSIILTIIWEEIEYDEKMSFLKYPLSTPKEHMFGKIISDLSYRPGNENAYIQYVQQEYMRIRDRLKKDPALMDIIFATLNSIIPDANWEKASSSGTTVKVEKIMLKDGSMNMRRTIAKDPLRTVKVIKGMKNNPEYKLSQDDLKYMYSDTGCRHDFAVTMENKIECSKCKEKPFEKASKIDVGRFMEYISLCEWANQNKGKFHSITNTTPTVGKIDTVDLIRDYINTGKLNVEKQYVWRRTMLYDPNAVKELPKPKDFSIEMNFPELVGKLRKLMGGKESLKTLVNMIEKNKLFDLAESTIHIRRILNTSKCIGFDHYEKCKKTEKGVLDFHPEIVASINPITPQEGALKGAYIHLVLMMSQVVTCCGDHGVKIIMSTLSSIERITPPVDPDDETLVKTKQNIAMIIHSKANEAQRTANQYLVFDEEQKKMQLVIDDAFRDQDIAEIGEIDPNEEGQKELDAVEIEDVSEDEDDEYDDEGDEGLVGDVDEDDLEAYDGGDDFVADADYD